MSSDLVYFNNAGRYHWEDDSPWDRSYGIIEKTSSSHIYVRIFNEWHEPHKRFFPQGYPFKPEDLKIIKPKKIEEYYDEIDKGEWSWAS